MTEFIFFVNYPFKEGRLNEFDADVIEKVVWYCVYPENETVLHWF